MPIRGELSSPATHFGLDARETQLFVRHISKRLRTREVMAALIVAVISLFGAVLFALLFPLPDDIAATLAVFS